MGHELAIDDNQTRFKEIDQIVRLPKNPPSQYPWGELPMGKPFPEITSEEIQENLECGIPLLQEIEKNLTGSLNKAKKFCTQLAREEKSVQEDPTQRQLWENKIFATIQLCLKLPHTKK